MYDVSYEIKGHKLDVTGAKSPSWATQVVYNAKTTRVANHGVTQ